MATVRATYELNTRPARSALRPLRTDLRETERYASRAAREMDKIGSPRQVTQVKRYAGEIGGLRREMEGALAVASGLRVELDRLGRTRSTPSIDLEGIAAAGAQIEALEARLTALGARTARPSVNPRGIGRTAATGGAITAARGAGGAFRSLSLGPVNLGRAAGPAIIGLGLPAGRALIGGAGALVGSAGAGLLGAGAVGAGGITPMIAGAGALGGTAALAAGRIGAANDALTDFREAIREFGRDSREAREAQALYNAELRRAPGRTEALLRGRDRFVRGFRQETMPGQNALTGVGVDFFRTGRQLTPLLGNQANDISRTANVAAGDYFDFFESRQGRRGLRAGANIFDENLRGEERVLENITATLFNLTRASRPFFREAVDFLEEWTDGWREGTDDIGGTRREIAGMIEDFKAWMRLGDAAVDLLLEIGGAGRRQGRGLVDDLTGQLREWERWIDRNPREVRQFFRETADDTRDIAAALGDVVTFLEEMGELLRPLLPVVRGLADALGAMGPGAIPALVAGRGALRGMRGAGGAIPGGAGAGAGAGGVFIGGAGRRPPAPRGGSRAIPVGGSPFISGRERVGPIRGAAGRVPGAVGAGARAYLPYALAFGALGGLGTEGGAADKLRGGISTALPIVPAPPSPDDAVAQAEAMVQRLLARRDRPSRRNVRGLRQSATALRESGGVFVGDEHVDLPDAEAARLAHDLEAGADSLTRIKGEARALDLTKAFEIRVEGGATPAKAFEEYRKGVGREMKRLDDDTSKAWGKTTANWLRELKRSNPKLRGEVEDITKGINRRYRKLDQDLKIIHGRIRDTSADAWTDVRKQLVSETQLARQEGTAQLTGLQHQAVEVLINMGFGRGDAAKLVRNLEAGGSRGQAAKYGMEQGPGSIGAAIGTGQAAGPVPTGKTKRKARGGRIAGGHIGGRNDHVNLGGGVIGAGDELVVNRHTEQRIDGFLRAAGTSLDREVKRESRPHSGPMVRPGMPGFRERNAARGLRMLLARGGRTGGGSPMTQAKALAESMGLAAGEGPGTTSGHATGSLHYQGLAWDVSGAASGMYAYRRRAEKVFGGSINELFYDPYPYYIADGQRVQGAFGDHGDHVHIGFFAGAKAGKMGRKMGGMMGAPAQIKPGELQAPGSRAGGLPGAASNRRGDIAAEGMRQQLNKRLKRMGGIAGGSFRGGGAGTLSQQQIQQLASSVGMKNPRLMAAIAMAESGGDVDIVNSIGATGLWQVLQSAHPQYPASQLKTARGNAMAAKEILGSQGLSAWEAYTNGMYQQYMSRGGRVGRWAGWNRRGGSFTAHGATLFGAGEAGPERVKVEPLTNIRKATKGAIGGSRPVEINVNMGGVTVKNEADEDRLADKVGAKIAAALRNDDDVESDNV